MNCSDFMKHSAKDDFAERVRVNQRELASKLRERFDYIVCGAGTSGCVVAVRLASDRRRTFCCFKLVGLTRRK